MINTQTNNLYAPVRQIKARVELLSGSTLADTYTERDRIKEITVERVAESSKFFGFGICQKANIKLIDKERALDINTANSFKIAFDGVYCMPLFNVSRVNRDENTNELSITAYDALYRATNYTVADLSIGSAYTLKEFVTACATLLNLSLKIDGLETAFNLSYPVGANLEGTENIREVLDAIAEVTQTIYFVNFENKLVFKRLDQSGEAALRIDKASYITLESGTNRRLSTISHVTELGDNLTTSISTTGSTQYIRDNPFLELREDIATLLDNALAAVGGLTINQFVCSWRGNYLVEIGDKLALETKDNNTVYSFLLDDVISYNGSLSEETQWSYEDNEAETEANPTSLGDVIKQTYAKVDKTNKRIDLVASDIQGNTEKISKLELTTDGITTNVSNITKEVQEVKDTANTATENISNLTERVTTAETSITQNKNAIELRATKEEVKTIDGKIQNNSTKIAQLELTTDNITTNVSNITKEVTEVQTTAETAKNTADTAKATADGAKSDANTAKTTATTAKGTADTAKATADTAKNTADSAKTAADTATANVTTLTERVTTAETKITQNADAIELRATKEEVSTVDGKVESNSTEIAALQINTDSVSLSVAEIKEDTTESINSLNEDIASLSNRVDAVITTEDVRLEIKQEIAKGADKVITATGFTFNEDGLTVSKSGNEMSTQITENGMTVFKDSEAVLIADNEGVKAEDLQATTYLIIGKNSRFEDYSTNRTGCFWIGG